MTTTLTNLDRYERAMRDADECRKQSSKGTVADMVRWMHEERRYRKLAARYHALIK